MIRIRPGLPSDADAVFAISAASLPEAWSMDSIRSELEGGNLIRFMVAEDQDGLVGFMHWWMVMDEAQVMNIAVHPTRRRMGAGKELLLAAIRSAREEGASTMVLEVREGNLPARSLYESVGFTVVANRPGYYPDNGENALIMALDFVHV